MCDACQDFIYGCPLQPWWVCTCGVRLCPGCAPAHGPALGAAHQLQPGEVHGSQPDAPCECCAAIEAEEATSVQAGGC
jgi:hypothetical protein